MPFTCIYILYTFEHFHTYKFNPRISNLIWWFAVLYAMMKVKVRPVQEDDSDILLEWRNDEDVRRQSFNTEVISKDNHDSWFSKVLSSTSTLLLIAEGPKKARLGQIRFDIDQVRGEVTVNISIAKEHRGKKISEEVLRTALSYLKKERTFLKVLAFVKANNFPSKRMFERVGFKVLKTEPYRGSNTVFYVLNPNQIR
jgi:UDP-2,4-diacetamido-2,4,6-trideoxy-beta-L-altropyranose hydrolase